MVTWENGYQKAGSKAITVAQGTCLSSDTKPTNGVANGSVLLEIDTSKVFFFDSANSTWRAWA